MFGGVMPLTAYRKVVDYTRGFSTMIHDVVSAEYRGDYKIELCFDDGKRGIVDFTKYLEQGGVFERLRDPVVFRRFRINEELGVLTWEGDVDVCRGDALFGRNRYASAGLDEFRRDNVAPTEPVMDLTLLSLLGIAVGLAMDAFAVSVAAGLAVAAVTPRHVFRVSFHFGLFQFMMPIIGWLVGGKLAGYAGDYSPWVAFVLLVFVGGKMLWEARGENKAESGRDPTRGLMLVTLSVATSLDALAVGMSMAFLGVRVWIPSVVIGIVTAALSAMGITFGGRIGPRWEHWAEAAGGIVLILMGVKVLLLG